MWNKHCKIVIISSDKLILLMTFHFMITMHQIFFTFQTLLLKILWERFKYFLMNENDDDDEKELKSELSEELNMKRLKYLLNLTSFADCFISLRVVFYLLIPRNIRKFCHFDFVYRGSTSFLYAVDLASCSCVIIWSSNLWARCSCLRSEIIKSILHITKYWYTPLIWIKLGLTYNWFLSNWSVFKVVAL